MLHAAQGKPVGWQSLTKNVTVELVSVVRSVGACGTVTVHCQTARGNAIPDLDYTPTSGTLTFGPGVTTQSFMVPVLDNPHDNHDELVGLVLASPTQGAVFGNTVSAVLRIHDIDPDVTPQQVSSLHWFGTSTTITSIVLTFSEPILAAPAGSGAAYQLADLGTSGQAHPSSI